MIARSRLVSFATLLVAGLILITALWVERMNDVRHVAQNRAEAFADLALIGARLETALLSDVHMVHGLAGLIVANPRLGQAAFERAASQIVAGNTKIKSLSLAPDMTIRQVHPLRGNERAIGLDLGRHPTQSQAARFARESRQIVVAGPLQLVQGGNAVVSRIPVFLDPGTPGERFWGLVSAAIDTQRLLHGAGILDPNLPYEIALRGKDARGSNGEVFWGRPELFAADPVIVDIGLPTGSWQAAAIPRGGWPTQAPNVWRIRLGFLLVTVLILGPLLGLGRSMRALGAARTRLDSERRRFNATLENTPNVGVQWFRQDGSMIYWNRASEAIYGWSAADMLGKDAGCMLADDEMLRFMALLGQVADTGSPQGPVEFHVRRRDGEQRVVSSTIFSIPGDGEPVIVCMDIDVTESRRLARMQIDTLESMPDAIVVVDTRGLMTQVNQQTASMFGYTREELLGAPVEMLMPERLRRGHDDHRRSFLREPRVREMGSGMELAALTKEGREFPIDVCLGPIHTDAGDFVVATLRDISERKRVMGELRAARDRAQRYLDTAQTVMLSLDRDGRILMVNRKGCELLGYSEDELIGRDWFATCLPTDEGDILREIFRRMMGGDIDPADTVNNVVVCRDGRRRLIAWRSAKLHDDDGRISGLLSSGEDVTERVDAENRLVESQQRFSFAVEGAGDGVWDWNLETDDLLCSRSCMAMFGGDGEERHCIDDWIGGIHPEDRPRIIKGRDEYAAGRSTSFTSEFRMRGRVGDYKWILCRATIVGRDANGNPTRMIGIQTDISARKQAEEELRQARDAAEEASRAKSRFLTNMSHELRTPLNAIIGFAQMLDMGAPVPLHEAQKEPVGHILGSGRHLLQIINDLLDLARIETGRMELVIESLPLAPLVAEAVNLCRPAAEVRRIAVRINGVEGKSLRGDRVRVRQVLLNLLSNAVKYNVEGGAVELDCVEVDEMVRISVHDTGPGIPKNRRDEAFLPFHRLGAEHGAVEGSGIGLAVTKQLIEAMEGRIGIADHGAVGTTFWVELPCGEDEAASGVAEPADAIASAAHANGPFAVLYVEDNQVNLRLMQHALAKRPNLKLIEATTGEEGIQLARQHLPHLILMDINLPGLDGFATLLALRDDVSTSRIPVIAITANAMKGDRERAMAAGFAEYLTKPLNIGNLYSAIDRHLAQSSSTDPVS